MKPFGRVDKKGRRALIKLTWLQDSSLMLENS